MRAQLSYLAGIQSTAAASAGTTYLYFPVAADMTTSPHKAFVFKGFMWGYQTAEANTDNTLDFVIARDITDADGTFDGASDTLHTNANACGLLDSVALGRFVTNKGNAVMAGGAAVAVTPTETRVAAGDVIRVAVTTAGTGTVPAINFAIIGNWV